MLHYKWDISVKNSWMLLNIYPIQGFCLLPTWSMFLAKAPHLELWNLSALLLWVHKHNHLSILGKQTDPYSLTTKKKSKNSVLKFLKFSQNNPDSAGCVQPMRVVMRDPSNVECVPFSPCVIWSPSENCISSGPLPSFSPTSCWYILLLSFCMRLIFSKHQICFEFYAAWNQTRVCHPVNKSRVSR